MPGVKGRSGGHNRKPVEEHMAQGTYRKDRHAPAAMMSASTALADTSNIMLLQFSDDEKECYNMLRGVMKNIPEHMVLAFNIFVHDLALYCRSHAELIAAKNIQSGKKGDYLSAQFRARNEALKNLRADFSIFAMSITDQAALFEIAVKNANRIKKPSAGKPLE